MLIVLTEPMSKVYAFGSARPAYSVPMVPPAPGRLSTRTGTASARARRSEKTRAMKSVPPPGVKGTTMVMGFDGYCCAWAAAQADSQKAAITTLP